MKMNKTELKIKCPQIAKVHFEVRNMHGQTLVACKKDHFVKTSKILNEVNCKSCLSRAKKSWLHLVAIGRNLTEFT